MISGSEPGPGSGSGFGSGSVPGIGDGGVLFKIAGMVYVLFTNGMNKRTHTQMNSSQTGLSAPLQFYRHRSGAGPSG